MRALLQRIQTAGISVSGQKIADSGQGFLIFLGVGASDTQKDADILWKKIYQLRVFEDINQKMNISLDDIHGQVLIVSQFTLYANCLHGRRPSFSEAAKGQKAKELYDYFCKQAQDQLGKERVSQGIFGADMKVNLVNDGPVTIWLDTKELPTLSS